MHVASAIAVALAFAPVSVTAFNCNSGILRDLRPLSEYEFIQGFCLGAFPYLQKRQSGIQKAETTELPLGMTQAELDLVTTETHLDVLAIFSASNKKRNAARHPHLASRQYRRWRGALIQDFCYCVNTQYAPQTTALPQTTVPLTTSCPPGSTTRPGVTTTTTSSGATTSTAVPFNVVPFSGFEGVEINLPVLKGRRKRAVISTYAQCELRCSGVIACVGFTHDAVTLQCYIYSSITARFASATATSALKISAGIDIGDIPVIQNPGAPPDTSVVLPSTSVVLPTSSLGVSTSSISLPSTSSISLPSSSIGVSTSSIVRPTTTSIVLPSTSGGLSTSSIVLPSTSLGLSTSSVVLPSTSLPLSSSSLQVPTTSLSLPGSTTSVDLPTSTPDVDFTIIEGSILVGAQTDGFNSTSVDDCQSTCASFTTCQAFSFDSTEFFCLLFDAVIARYLSADATSGVKVSAGIDIGSLPVLANPAAPGDTDSTTTSLDIPTTSLSLPSTTPDLSSILNPSTTIDLPITTELPSTSLGLPTTSLDLSSIVTSIVSDISSILDTSTSIDLPITTELPTTSLGIPITTDLPTSIDLPTTSLEIPTTSLDLTSIELPTTSLDLTTEVPIPTTSIDLSSIDLPTTSVDLSSIDLPTTSLDLTSIDVPTTSLDLTTEVPIPTTSLDLSSIVSSVVSDITSLLPDTTTIDIPLPTTTLDLPTTSLDLTTEIPIPTTSLDLSSIVSSIVSDISSLLPDTTTIDIPLTTTTLDVPTSLVTSIISDVTSIISDILTTELPTTTLSIPDLETTTLDVPTSTLIIPPIFETTASVTESLPPVTTVSIPPIDSTTTATSIGAVVTNQAFIDTVLRHHNVHRANHSAVALTWDANLAASAKILADTCVYGHNTVVGGGGYGQNIGAGYDPLDMGSFITTGLYNSEVNNYVLVPGTVPGTFVAPPISGLANWGHFTQIVWKGTRSVGCYVSDCSGGFVDSNNQPLNPLIPPYFAVCNYSPPGNVVGAFDLNVSLGGGAATIGPDYQCPSAQNCVNGSG